MKSQPALRSVRRVSFKMSPPLVLSAAALMFQPTLSKRATAAELSTDELAEVVVTAERKTSNLQQTPLSVSAIDGDALQSQQNKTLESLSESVPNLEIGRNAGDAHVFIRGVGTDQISPGGETRVALYTDEVYQSRSQAAFLGFYDVDRVEVLRGPQGSLYGRNAVAGAINIITRDPTSTMDGYVSGTVGNYDLVASEGALGGPLTNDLSARLAFQTVDRQGYGSNVDTGQQVDDEHTRSARGKLKYQPLDALTVRLNTDITHESDHSGGYRYLGPASYLVPTPVATGISLGYPAPPPRDTGGYGPLFGLDTYGASVDVDWRLNDQAKIVSITGYRHLTTYTDTNLDFTAANTNEDFIKEHSNQWSEELRFTQGFGSFADVLLGGYAYRERNFASNTNPIAGIVLGIPTLDLYEAYQAGGTVLTKAYAGFAQFSLHLTDKADVILGGRYSHETKGISEYYQFDTTRLWNPSNPVIPNIGTDQQSESESSTDPSVTVDYKFTPSIFAYATYSTGFKSGGFNIGALQPPFKAEKIKNHEIGIKADLLNRKLRIDASAFYYDYKNLQVNIAEGEALITQNAASSRIKGVETEIAALPFADLRVGLNVAYLDAKYLDFVTADPSRTSLGPLNLKGNTLNYAPRYKVDGQIGYTFHTSIGQIEPQLDVTRTGTVYFSQFNLSQVSQPAWTAVNAYVNYTRESSGWAVNGYIKNLTNKLYSVGGTVSSGLYGYPIVGEWGPPRTYGVQITKKF
jgi:iron complex outermembrane receptor protein